MGSDHPDPGDTDLTWAVSILANGTRLRIVRCLSGGPSTFTQLAHYLGLDPFTQCGLLEYHLTQLKQAGIAVRTSTDYRLTDLGRKLSRFALGVEKLYESTMTDREGKGGDVLEGKWSVSRIGRDDMEDFLDFWIERFEFDPSHREKAREHFAERFLKKNCASMIARPKEGGAVAGYLDGMVGSLGDFEKRGEIGQIYGVYTKTGSWSVVSELLDGFEEYLRGRPRCHGVVVPQLSPELGEEQTGLLNLLRTRGYYIQNSYYVLRKDLDEAGGMFRPREKLGKEDLARLEKESKKKRAKTIKLP